MSTKICCCNIEPPTLRCGPCQVGDHESCADVSMPVRPNPSVPRPLPRDPGRKSEGMTIVGIFLLTCAGVLFFIVMWLVVRSSGSHEDRRELRRFGEMECVYNVDTDEIEECTRAPG